MLQSASKYAALAESVVDLIGCGNGGIEPLTLSINFLLLELGVDWVVTFEVGIVEHCGSRREGERGNLAKHTKASSRMAVEKVQVTVASASVCSRDAR